MRALLVLLALARAAAADPRVVEGEDETRITGTIAGLGKHDALDQHRDVHWSAVGAAVTIGKVVDDGAPNQIELREQIQRSRAFEATLVRALATRTFAQDVPVALDADELGALAQTDRAVTPQRVVVTWAGTNAGIAHCRVYAIFALGSIGMTGQATLAGTLDVDVARKALLDMRMSGVVSTAGLVQLDAKASAHLTRRYR